MNALRYIGVSFEARNRHRDVVKLVQVELLEPRERHPLAVNARPFCAEGASHFFQFVGKSTFAALHDRHEQHDVFLAEVSN